MPSNTIPASYFVTVNPAVASAGGTGTALSGLFLTNNTRVPIGAVMSFPNSAAVATFFGASSTEYAKALVYFAGFDNSSIKPGAMLFSQFNTTAVSAYLNGGNISGLTLAQLQALTPGTISVTIDGVVKTSGTINLSAATSFSNAATLIQTALGASPATVTYDSVSGGFVVTSGTTGATSTITFATGPMSTALMLTQATGAYLSQGAVAPTPAAQMASVVAVTQNWATFTHTFNPDVSGNTNKLAFAAWVSGQNDQFAYIVGDTDITATTTVPATSSLGYLVAQANYSGVMCVWEPSALSHATALMGMIASINFNQTAGRATLAYKSQAGLTPGVTSATVAANLQANGYNFYGIAATGSQQFNFFYPGSISGPFKWADSYVNQIWLNSQFQADFMTLLTNVRSIPYNAQGYGLMEAAILDTIKSAVDFGLITPGVTLSALQVAEVNAAAGMAIATTLQNRGWYLQIKDASPTVRAARSSPPCTFWYADGGSVQQINLASIDVQ
jgi:hypothetical protein